MEKTLSNCDVDDTQWINGWTIFMYCNVDDTSQVNCGIFSTVLVMEIVYI
jgi:hypothetical protein